MTQPGNYSRSPLTEALLDIQIARKGGIALEDLKKCHEKVKSEYPGIQPIRILAGTFEIGDSPASEVAAHEVGFRFVTPDFLQMFQARQDGFTHNRLAPYQGWELFRNESRRLWNIYREIVNPDSVTRIAARYINRIDIPLPKIDIQHYLRTSPEISPSLPQDIISFFMQVTLQIPEIKAAVNITETAVEPAAPGIVSLILDLDLYRTADIPADEEGIWNLFESFRAKKDEIFEACITNKTRELIR